MDDCRSHGLLGRRGQRVAPSIGAAQRRVVSSGLGSLVAAGDFERMRVAVGKKTEKAYDDDGEAQDLPLARSVAS